MKFLIIRFSSIGDIVLTTPVVRCIKQQLPDAKIHYLTKKSYKNILEHNPYVDSIHILQESISDLVKELRTENFDYIIDLHNNLRTWRIKTALNKIPAYSFNKLNYKKWVLTALKINKLPPVHIVDRYLKTVEAFGVINDNKGLDYFIPEKDEITFSQLPTSHLHGYIAMVIGAALNTKKLPIDKLAELCKKIEHPIILLGGPEDKQDGDAIAATDNMKIYNACGKFNLNQSADLIKKAKLVISHDTGLMHIAAAFQKIILSVWGNTVPEFGMYPYFATTPTSNNKEESRMFEIKNLHCRPCSKIGYKKCPLGHFKCMQLQDTDLIATTTHSLIKK